METRLLDFLFRFEYLYFTLTPGRVSAGVKRQYCGRKIENCQVGVFGALCGGSLTALVHSSLFGVEEKASKIDQAVTIIGLMFCVTLQFNYDSTLQSRKHRQIEGFPNEYTFLP
jgi:hypothetical protein